MEHLTTDVLEGGLAHVRDSPTAIGRVELIVRRPRPGERELVETATLDCIEGLVGDNWRVRGNRRTPDGSAKLAEQLTLMNDRAATLVAGSPERRALAGDQIYVDFDLSLTNLPAGTRVKIGTALIEISEDPHTGCAKFSERFGLDAVRFVNSAEGRHLRLRGVNTRVVVGGVVAVGDVVRKLDGDDGV